MEKRTRIPLQRYSLNQVSRPRKVFFSFLVAFLHSFTSLLITAQPERLCLRKLSKKKKSKSKTRDSTASKLSLPDRLCCFQPLLPFSSFGPSLLFPCVEPKRRQRRDLSAFTRGVDDPSRVAPHRAQAASQTVPSSQSQRTWTPVVLATVRGKAGWGEKMTVNKKRSLALLPTRTCLSRRGREKKRRFLLFFLLVLLESPKRSRALEYDYK